MGMKRMGMKDNGYEIGMNKLREKSGKERAGKLGIGSGSELGCPQPQYRTGILMKSSRRSPGSEVPWGPLTRGTSVSPPS